MNLPTNDDSNYESQTDKGFARKKQATHFVHFLDPSEHYGVINLDPEILGELKISSQDVFVEEIVPEGILLRRVTGGKEQ